MQLLIYVLNNEELLDDLLESFLEAGIKGATILESTGMARELASNGNHQIPIFGSLKLMLNEVRPHNRTIFVALEDEQVDTCIGCIKDVVGDLNKPDAGIVLTVPITRIEGIKNNNIES
ncbi:MAG TPA: hypothetical protein GXX36_02040 [Clostridiaceae bacterium]|nr:hypothetical protein [Clostridiaceae bacterium]